MSDREDRLPKSWFLVEWDVSEGPSTYTVVNWSNLIGHPARSKLCTGKTVFVRRGKDVKPATIVIMSDDKRFLDTELQQLRSIAAANLQNKNEVSRKRRKLHMSVDSSSDCLSSANSRLCSPSPTPSHHTSFQFNANAPPMTFDQQTQTELKILNLDNNVAVDNSLLLELKQTQVLLREEFKDLARKTDNLYKSITQFLSSQAETKHATCSSISSPLGSTPLTNKIKHKSSISIGEHSPNENSICVDSDVDIEADYNHRTPLGNSQKMNLTFNGYSNNNISSVKPKPWEVETFPNDMVPIGPGKTLVPLQVMTQINWTSHSNATRRLMMALFSRHTLATHTLTGKASPAFNGPNSKPQKRRLDPAIIIDIIETVSKYCGVKESVVRSAITTKCADENKMLRARKVKEEITPDENNDANDNKC